MISKNSGETDFSLSPRETVDNYVNTLRFYLKSEEQPNRDDFNNDLYPCAKSPYPMGCILQYV